ncbi:hypothetical protein VKT23_008964 [Stygiomarasmius scandens]|uniref:Uncharacterized protein n=1 Tax=Marasmiellus scandens TaxID=2682957 RepID=A0ABR1JLD2_9AGAR
MGTEIFAVDVSELSRVVSPLQLEMALYVPPDHSSKVPLESGLSMCVALSNVPGRSASSVSMLRAGDRCVFLESRRLRVMLDDKEDYSVTTKNSLLSYLECLDLSSADAFMVQEVFFDESLSLLVRYKVLEGGDNFVVKFAADE